MIDNTTTNAQSPINGNFTRNSTSTTPEPIIHVPLSVYQVMSQAAPLNSELLVNKPLFSTKHVFIIIGVVISGVFAVTKIYFDITSDIKNLNTEINNLSKKYTSLDDSKYKDDFYEIKLEVEGLKQQLQNYNFKSLNNEIIKINTQITSIKNEIDKNTEKIKNRK